MIFKTEFKANLRDIATWLGKNPSDLTMEDMKKVIPESLWDNDVDSPFALVHIRDPYVKSKWWQRLNRVWVIPCYIVLVGPFKWIFTGEWGVSKRTRFGAAFLNMIGEK